MITLDDVREFGASWFDAVAGGASAAEQAQFFLNPHARIYVVWNGATISLEDHEKLHAQWINERHSFGHFDLTPLNASPERVRARGTVYWQAEFQGRPAPNVIKAVVGEDWILERAASGGLKFVLYLNTFHHLLPESRRSICDGQDKSCRNLVHSAACVSAGRLPPALLLGLRSSTCLR